MVNEYEKRTGKEMKVDVLLTVSELRERGKLMFNEIVALTQRKPETIRGEIDEWIADGVIGKCQDGADDLYVLDKRIKVRIKCNRGRHDLGTIKARLLAFIKANGTVKRAQVCELCVLTEKQANNVLIKMLESGEIVKYGRGPATAYKLAEGS
jgi:ATP-dependent DNA helicase RecG